MFTEDVKQQYNSNTTFLVDLKGQGHISRTLSSRWTSARSGELCCPLTALDHILAYEVIWGHFVDIIICMCIVIALNLHYLFKLGSDKLITTLTCLSLLSDL